RNLIGRNAEYADRDVPQDNQEHEEQYRAHPGRLRHALQEIAVRGGHSVSSRTSPLSAMLDFYPLVRALVERKYLLLDEDIQYIVLCVPKTSSGADFGFRRRHSCCCKNSSFRTRPSGSGSSPGDVKSQASTRHGLQYPSGTYYGTCGQGAEGHDRHCGDGLEMTGWQARSLILVWLSGTLWRPASVSRLLAGFCFRLAVSLFVLAYETVLRRRSPPGKIPFLAVSHGFAKREKRRRIDSDFTRTPPETRTLTARSTQADQIAATIRPVRRARRRRRCRLFFFQTGRIPKLASQSSDLWTCSAVGLNNWMPVHVRTIRNNKHGEVWQCLIFRPAVAWTIGGIGGSAQRIPAGSRQA